MRRLAAASALAVLAATACSTPTLPLPPPTALSSAPDAQGYATVTGSALDGAYILCRNARTDTGVFVRVPPDGLYSLRIQAVSGDSLELWVLDGTDQSDTVEILVP